MHSDLRNLQNLHNLDTEIVTRYTDQPPRLPPELRREIELAWHGAPVQLYALADLDHALRLVESWVALGPEQVAVARRAGAAWEITSVERARIHAVREAPGLSATSLTLRGYRFARGRLDCQVEGAGVKVEMRSAISVPVSLFLPNSP